jgi:phage recombination protein Bet
MSTDLAPAPTGGGALVTRDYLNERRELIREQLAPGASDAEMELLIEVSAARGLNPITRQIYGVMRWDGRKQKEVMSIQTGIDGFRLVAQRTGDYAGQVGPEWCGTDGVWKDVWLEKEPPAAARVGVYRKGFTVPVFGLALYEEYVARNKKREVTGQWATMPALMVAKCAEALALRKAFPEDLSGLYTGDEMQQADNAARVTAAPTDVSDATTVAKGRVDELTATYGAKAVREAMGATGVTAATQIANDADFARLCAALNDAPAEGEVTHEGDDDPVITEAQRKRLEAIAKELGRDHDWLKAIVVEAGFASSTKIPQSQYEAIEQAMRAEASYQDQTSAAAADA